MIRVAIFGATGYASFELIKILLRHPEAEIVYLGSRRDPPPQITDIFPSLLGLIDMQCGPLSVEALPDEVDVVFTALPHKTAMEHVPNLLGTGLRVIDFSADYRFRDIATYEAWYDVPHTDRANAPKAVYGLPELHREQIVGATLIANPGCYPTAAILAAAPFIEKELVANRTIIFDAKSGVSGAGRTPALPYHFPECNESLKAYKIARHRHGPEIAEQLELLAGAPVQTVFVPHLVPMDRGILCTSYVPAARPISQPELDAILSERYASEPFVRVRTGGALPTTKDVSFTNFCDMAAFENGETPIVVSVIDNLVKGASGQAVQNMNLMFGLPETMGLWTVQNR